MDARLRVLSGPHAGETFDVEHGKLLIGREEDCHLRPDSEFVSRHHCVLLLDDFTLRARDLGSKNGTFVNGRRIGGGETILLHDDMVSIGEMICQIDLTQPNAVDTEVAPATTTTLASTGTVVFEGDTVQTDVPLPATAEMPATPPPGPPVRLPLSISEPGHNTETFYRPGP
jgi:predicted component of type VI protein secretion system